MIAHAHAVLTRLVRMPGWMLVPIVLAAVWFVGIVMFLIGFLIGRG